MLVSRKAQDAGLVVAVVLLGILTFGLGRLSVLSEEKTPVALCATPIMVDGGITATPAPARTSGVSTPETQGTYVASKSGAAYHFPWCSGAQRIKEENKIWFMSKEDAEAAGYRPASNCKGL